MKTYNAIIYQCPEEPDRFIAEGFEVSQRGIGSTKDEAVSELARATGTALDEFCKDRQITLNGANSDTFLQLRQRIDFDDPQAAYATRDIQGEHAEAQLHFYDGTPFQG